MLVALSEEAYPSNRSLIRRRTGLRAEPISHRTRAIAGVPLVQGSPGTTGRRDQAHHRRRMTRRATVETNSKGGCVSMEDPPSQT